MKELKAYYVLDELNYICLDMPLKDAIEEAIKEPEELNNIGCNGCKYESEKDCNGNFIIVCKRHPRLTDRYEPKQ